MPPTISEREQELLKIDEELEAQQKRAVEKADEACRQQDARLQAIIGGVKSSAKLTQLDSPSSSVDKVREESSSFRRNSKSKPIRKNPSPVPEVQESPVSETESEAERFRNEQSSSDVGVPKEIGDKATIRLQRAKLKSIHADLTKSLSRNKVLEQKLSSCQTSNKKLKEQNVKLSKQLQNSESANDKHVQITKEQEQRITELERQITSLEKELKQTDRAAKQIQNKGNSKDVRLNRAMEEIEKLKGIIKEKDSARQEASGCSQAQIEKLEEENRKLDKQKQELFAAFKKQLKLIDVLKRQKLHVEAAKMLSFTEEEFAQIIDV